MYTVAAAVVARGNYSPGAFAVAVGVGVEVVLGAAHIEALVASDGSAAAESARSSGTVDFPYMPCHFHCRTAGAGAGAGAAVAAAADAAAVAVAGSTQPAAASAGGH